MSQPPPHGDHGSSSSHSTPPHYVHAHLVLPSAPPGVPPQHRSAAPAVVQWATLPPPGYAYVQGHASSQPHALQGHPHHVVPASAAHLGLPVTGVGGYHEAPHVTAPAYYMPPLPPGSQAAYAAYPAPVPPGGGMWVLDHTPAPRPPPAAPPPAALAYDAYGQAVYLSATLAQQAPPMAAPSIPPLGPPGSNLQPAGGHLQPQGGHFQASGGHLQPPALSISLPRLGDGPSGNQALPPLATVDHVAGAPPDGFADDHAARALGGPVAQVHWALEVRAWKDEGTMVVGLRFPSGLLLCRRTDNGMVNGTKLLNMTGMSRGRRDAFLKVETQRVVVRSGALHLKGVWIPRDSAERLAHAFNLWVAVCALLTARSISPPLRSAGPSSRARAPARWRRVPRPLTTRTVSRRPRAADRLRDPRPCIILPQLAHKFVRV